MKTGDRISTGFTGLDGLFGGGLSQGKMYVIGGRPSMGKTAFAISLALSACRQGKKVLYYSLGTERDKFTDRVKMIGSTEELPQTFAVDDTASINVEDIGRSEDAKDADLIVVDCLQLVGIAPENMKDEYEYISDRCEYICSVLKHLATDVNATVLLNVMLPKDLEKRSKTQKRPRLSDLRDFRAAAETADAVMFLYREGYYNITLPDRDTAEVCVAVNGDGVTGTCIIGYDHNLGRFIREN